MINEVAASVAKGGDICSILNAVNIDLRPADFGSNSKCAFSSPTEGFASILDAIDDIRQGKMVVISGDEKRESKGYIMVAASQITPEAIDFLMNRGSGIIYVTVEGGGLEKLQSPFMNVEHSTTACISANDLATTILALASRESNVEYYSSGSISLLRYREGGILERAGHREPPGDLAVLAGLEPIAVLCEVPCDDGSTERLTKLHKFANEENLKIISITDLIRHRRINDKLIELTASVKIPTTWGTFTAYCYQSITDGIEHIAMVKGKIGEGHDVLVRVHSECLTGDIFGSARCDCGNQLALAMQLIERTGRGVLVYNRGHEGRGIGLGNKLRAYVLQDAGLDTVDANIELGLPVDSREYHISAQILRHLGVQSVRLLTNNPVKCVELRSYGLAVIDRIPVVATITKENERYLETKGAKMNHVFGDSCMSNIINGC
ncbi:hypothetical protein SOVF_080340 [Spinacia oleracea]|uniref:GTP cyclohydrolase II n=1 Tax=Spinacia oleracea TaxID=3562 RepID=A0A9R0K155_SPIOL|nr:bifunctional riboflavin biosynthesis protein RIBA 1, chloroplastic-like isoform X2 [Spinacia oleracea]KNA17415.1 hypothetical protein SOVF_080340 [Spinacia oleracea]